jgi:AcrR family transcriptional regulator
VAPNELSLQERKQELVRSELFNAAWQLFGERGYEATTVAEIAAAAGVSRRTFFRYYASK